MTNSQFAPSPQHGAAWNVVLQHVVPHHCATKEALDEALKRLREITDWAATQQLPVRTAYLYAIPKVEASCREVFDLYENQRQVLAAVETIPKPPKWNPPTLPPTDNPPPQGDSGPAVHLMETGR